MSKVLIKVIPEAGYPEPSSAEFSNAFHAFFDIPEIKALFTQLLNTGDVTFAFRNQPETQWLPETREMMLPISLLNSSPVLSYINIARILCEISGRPLNDAYFMMLRAKQNSPAAFDHLASKVNITPDKLLFEYCLRASFTELTPAQEHMLTLAKLNIDYNGLDKNRQVQVKNLFATLVQMDTFKGLIEGVTKDKILSTFFVTKDMLPPGMLATIHQNSYILIDKDASLYQIAFNLVRTFVGSTLENIFVKFSSYPNKEEYATAFVKSLYDLECEMAKAMIELLGSQQSDVLLSIFFNKPSGDELIQIKLNQLIAFYSDVLKTPFDKFLEQNIAAYTDSIRDYQAWSQKYAPQKPVPVADTTSGSAEVIIDDEMNSTPMTTSFHNFQQVEASSSQMIDKDTTPFSELIQSCIERYKTYACSDALNYSKCIYPGKEAEIIERYKSKPIHHLQHEALANTQAQRGIYTPFTMKKISELIDQAKSGCCTTFAIAAAHRLLSENPNFIIQMVASPIEGMTAHCFLLVANKENRVDYMIVDPWLASLGWEGAFTPETYPFKHYFSQDLICLFDSEQPPKPTRTHKL